MLKQQYLQTEIERKNEEFNEKLKEMPIMGFGDRPKT
jgi:hypothetical protein